MSNMMEYEAKGISYMSDTDIDIYNGWVKRHNKEMVKMYIANTILYISFPMTFVFLFLNPPISLVFMVGMFVSTVMNLSAKKNFDIITEEIRTTPRHYC